MKRILFLTMTVWLLCSGTATWAQEKMTVLVSITDAAGEPLPGATVVEVGTNNSVTADVNGKCNISASMNAALEVSFMGYTTRQVTVTGSALTVQLEEGGVLLDEVVLVGYGTQRKSSITGSIASVNVDKMKDITTPSVANMLQGKIAGVSVIPTSGRPGDGATIRIRGLGSISGSKDPLWVIDGVVGNAVAELNPNDIESMSILKDGSATALYGSRGANGVVLVNTKRGTMGTSEVDVSVKMGIATLQRGNLRMMNGAEYYDYVTEAYTNQGSLPYWLQPYLREQNFDWWDFSSQNALSQNYNIGYRYGNEKIRSYISGDYYTEEGTVKGYDYQRFTLRSNTDYIVNSRLTLKSKIAASYRETFNQEYSLGSYTGYTPWDTPYDSQGNVKNTDHSTPTAADAPTADPRDYWYSDGSNFLYDRLLNWGRSRRNALDLGLGFDYKIFDFLTFESNNKFSFGNSDTESYTDPASRAGQAKKGTIYNSFPNNRYIYTSQLLRFVKTFGEQHRVSAYLGYDYDESLNWSADAQSSNMFPGNEVLSGGAADMIVSGGKSEERNAAYFFNGNYDFDDKYLFQASFRHDGSSRFGANKRWANFWSLGAGWNMHEEAFIQQLGFVNELKPRISYGITGNLPVSAYAWSTRFSTTQQYGGEVAFMTNYGGNRNLSWEETAALNVGLDIRLFDRVSIGFEAYSKKVKNLIYLKHLSAVTGYNRQYANDGKLENNGYEITITPEIINTNGFYWDISVNLGYNKNKITYLPPDGGDLVTQAVAVGYPYLNWYMREWAGIDAMTGQGLWFAVDKETGQKTATADYNVATPVLLNSSPTPTYNGGINTNFSWNGLSLNASFIFAAGAQIYNSQRAGALDRDATQVSQPAMRLADGWNRWEKPGDIATHPQLGVSSTASSLSTRYLENGDFFKMKTISLSYSLPKKWLTPLNIKEASISVGGENLFTITKYSGGDPEVLLSSSYSGYGNSSYPTVRRFTMGINLKF